MKPYFEDEWLTVLLGDCREAMASMEPASVSCVVTSPPYWGLRDYGTPGQLGIEATPEAYVEAMVGVFREVRRVLRDDGTVWLNLGDSYAAGGGSDHQRLDQLGERLGTGGGHKHSSRPSGRAPLGGLKPKDLVGIPWRVAFALQADGWYLRSDIIWSKPNPMPESVTDRPTKSHEYLFLLSKSARYYFDADAVREPHSSKTIWTYPITGGKAIAGHAGANSPTSTLRIEDPAGRNLRSVWTIATQPYPGAHFATFPEALVEPCVKAGSSERGVCPECGASWVREIAATKYEPPVVAPGIRNVDASRGDKVRKLSGAEYNAQVTRKTTGWRRSCAHTSEPVPATVLDPFAGSGTTGLVANRLGRRAVLIDLSADYLGQVMVRNAQKPLGLETWVEPTEPEVVA